MTLWLTRLTPSPTSRLAQRELGAGGATSLHRRVMSLFPDGIEDQVRVHFGILFRIEDTPRGSHLLLQSNQPPEPGRLPDGYGTLTTRSLDPLLNTLRPGLTLHYRCTASPVRKPGATTRALYDLPPVVALKGAAADEWWQRQADAAGLKPLTLYSQPLDAVQDRQHRSSPNDKPSSKSHRIRHSRTQFDGTATVIDPDQLRTVLQSGIGRGKAYGCGLLTIAPAHHRA
ncbi:type I-E CRISPR-associated protein Cas6/Cse3/CasE [Streptomyces griseoaurantiacus]|uniref:Type I-E CRISPR-associated protein Cas6/Cse3/CasE n=1 Tax=Streptomyces griseoaurantiacus TaxID=68213 RepID=A0A7W2DWD9_9ACTN|nr:MULTISPECIES: type I-E CRISPR-associated protein Cas6/Cse3/CasE [Streptomyces]MBA5224112.1 type I-E CRISPR-associated protein Cas6/Cse3/CasE [Streptomyces griseoaurantiacus]